MTIQKSNKLIAEFMQLEKEEGKGQPMMYRNNYDTSYFTTTHPDALKFHLFWNWLMPVVDKIESLSHSMKLSSTTYGKGYGKGVVCYYCWFSEIPVEDERTELYAGYNGASGEDRLSVVYKAVISFIKRYNQENKNEN